MRTRTEGLGIAKFPAFSINGQLKTRITMDYQEIYKMQQSREWKAAEELSNAVNSMGWKPKYFAMGVASQHRTLQQEIMRSFVAMIHVMASDDYGYDDRNKGSHEAAKKMVESHLLDEIYLPFI